MKLQTLQQQRRAVLYLSTFVFSAFVLWQFSDGMPIFFGPTASAAEKALGQELFNHEWQVNDPLAHGDGLGPVFNAKSCVACHFQGGIGGGGGNKQNVRNFSISPSTPDGEFVSGTIHTSSVATNLKETFELVRKKFPVVPGRTIQPPAPPADPEHCTYTPPPIVIPDFDPLRTESVQTTALFGAGWADMVSDKAIMKNYRRNLIKGTISDLKLDFDAIPQGRPRILKDGRVGKFGWKGQFATLEEFVAAACSNEIGLSNPKMGQAQPLSHPEYPVPENPDLDRKQFRALVGFVATLPKPIEKMPETAKAADSAILGKKMFKSIGCAVCHLEDIGGVRGIFTDFLLHKLEDPLPSGGDGYGPKRPELPPLPPDMPEPSEWKTPALWGVADSAPYMHDGTAPTLQAAIFKHGGDAKVVREAYKTLKADEQQAVLDFLGTLKAPEDVPQGNNSRPGQERRGFLLGKVSLYRLSHPGE
ncbi:thiol oxidoreductase-like protein [Telmatocola sphagniphila]|uniref:Thiol oxidoreductase-like protein n=1 Tax=Telmatocola sphagniphila TaxID=1123043 RepID=A0A8E6EYK7_9BACT|nr:di-heme oxidoredictase family protein [Telmatocola sphagniphila]QVL32471.1 thiol oxidoreductase-like protein [Telmatocola sphagniphila]